MKKPILLAGLVIGASVLSPNTQNSIEKVPSLGGSKSQNLQLFPSFKYRYSFIMGIVNDNSPEGIAIICNNTAFFINGMRKEGKGEVDIVLIGRKQNSRYEEIYIDPNESLPFMYNIGNDSIVLDSLQLQTVTTNILQPLSTCLTHKDR